jgi:hypothetical protein
MKRFVSTILFIFISISSVLFANPSSGSPDVTKYAWPPVYNTDTYGKPLLGYAFTLVDDFTQANTGESFSFIRTTSSQRWCENFSDSRCLNEIQAGASFWTNQVLPPCANASELINCIEAVNLMRSDGTVEKLVMEKLIAGNTWPETTNPKVEAGSSSSRWISPSEKNMEKGFKVTVSGGLGLTMSSRTQVTGARLSSFQASVEPYEKISGSFQPYRIYDSPGGFRSYGGTTPNQCIWVDENECGVQSEFAEGSKIEIILHLSSEISGWLLGRLNQPAFSSTYIGNSRVTGAPLNRVSISGYPVNVPLFSTKVDMANGTPELLQNFQENSFCKNNPNQCGGYFGGNRASSYFDYTYKEFQLFEKYFEETANKVFPRWSLRSLSAINNEYSRCRNQASGTIDGIVTTNSSIYQGTPPKFEDDAFVYKVAGLHYLPNKQVFQGSYDLALKSEFARCLYNFANSPIRASVEVTNSNGTNSVVTNTFTEKDGWVYLSINGFTFSQPTVKVKLTQEAQVTTTPSPSPSPSPSLTPSISNLKKTTITCVKGKITKKVTGFSPKCTAGYKKK